MNFQPFLRMLSKTINPPARQLVKGWSASLAPPQPPKDLFYRIPTVPTYRVPHSATRTLKDLFPRVPTHKVVLPSTSEFPIVPKHVVRLPSPATPARAVDRSLNLDDTWERLHQLNPNAWNPNWSLKEKLQQIQTLKAIRRMPQVPTHPVQPGIQRLDYAKAQAGIRELEALPSASTRPVRVGPKTILKPKNTVPRAIAAPSISASKPLTAQASAQLPKTKGECTKALQMLRRNKAKRSAEIEKINSDSTLNPGQKLAMLRIFLEQDRRDSQLKLALLDRFYALL